MGFGWQPLRKAMRRCRFTCNGVGYTNGNAHKVAMSHLISPPRSAGAVGQSLFSCHYRQAWRQPHCNPATK